MKERVIQELRKEYISSGLTEPMDEYLRRALIILAAVAGVSFVSAILIQALVWEPGILLLVARSLGVSIAATVLGCLAVFIYPNYTKDDSRKEMDKGLLPLVGLMYTLSKGGLSIERIMERLTVSAPDKYSENLARKFTLDVGIYGFNPQDALADIAERSPHMFFKQMVENIITTIQTSGDLTGLFKYQLNSLIQIKEEENQRLLGTLGFLSEIYVTVLVVAPLLLIIILTVFSFAGDASGAGGINSLSLIVFLGIPLIAVALLIIVDMQVN